MANRHVATIDRGHIRAMELSDHSAITSIFEFVAILFDEKLPSNICVLNKTTGEIKVGTAAEVFKHFVQAKNMGEDVKVLLDSKAAKVLHGRK